MPCRTTRELLEQIIDFHRQLGAFYEETAAKADREKAKALLEYMGRHEERLKECLGTYEKLAAKAILDTWFQFIPDIGQCECFDRIEVGQDMSIEDAIRISLWFDDCLIQFFRDMAALSPSSDVKELFGSLAGMEEQEKRKAARAAFELARGE